MIFEAVVSLLVGVVKGVFSLLGSAAAPGWMTSIAGQLNGLVSAGASLGTWVPWGAVGIAAGAVVTAMGTSLAIRAARIVLSLFTGGGGSAA